MQVQCKYRRFFYTAHTPNPRTIHRTVAKFSTIGTAYNVNEGRSDRSTARSEENVQVVREAVIHSPRKFIHHLVVEVARTTLCASNPHNRLASLPIQNPVTKSIDTRTVGKETRVCEVVFRKNKDR